MQAGCIRFVGRISRSTASVIDTKATHSRDHYFEGKWIAFRQVSMAFRKRHPMSVHSSVLSMFRLRPSPYPSCQMRWPDNDAPPEA